ncbi:MAG: carbohydrate binding domain-containing protein [Prevotellaceae bacterium]|jgi:uncharacterized repeat protein (TIGR02543 family)|nr:carbohydrate binding domain-containing protein [Prevotellaceae bacterium]
MKHKYFLLTAFLLLFSASIFGQQRYNADVENAGADCTVTLPGSFNTANANLPDPFLKLNGQRMTTKEEWTCRRQEILKLLERTVYGTKPGKPASVTGTVSRTSISVNVGGATFTANVKMPASGSAPYPLVIQYGGGVSDNIFTSRGCAVATLPLTAIAGGSRNGKTGAFYTATRESKTGHCAAWAWGVSRIIDVIEQDANKLFDPTAVGVTGCSRNGKGAFAAGVLDQRVALTMPMESGTGGMAAMRVSHKNRDQSGGTNGSQSPASAYSEQPWLGDDFNAFTSNPNNLPVDMHQAVALVAPRGFVAVYKTASSAGQWLGVPGSHVSAVAGAEVYKALGYGGNFAWLNTGTESHCSWTSSYTATINEFIDIFLLRTKANTRTEPLFTENNRPADAAGMRNWTTPTLSGTYNVGGEPLRGFGLTTAVSPATSGGKITVTPESKDGRYDGETVSLTPVAATNWEFEGWSGGATGTTVPLSIEMTKDVSVTAKFILVGDDVDNNLIKNGTFAGTADWTFSQHNNTAGTFTTAGNEGVIAVTQTGTADHNVQITQNGIPLEKGTKYRLTFDASAAAAREMSMFMQMDVDPWTSYHEEMVNLTTQKQSFSYEFEMKEATDENGRIAFNVGLETPTVKISNVNLIRIAEFGGTTPGTKVTLTLDANGGTVSNNSISVESGSSVGTLPTPNRPGYSFEGWFDENNVKYTEKTQLTADATVTASWRATGENLSEEELVDLIDELKGQVEQLTSKKGNLQQLLDECKGTTSDETLRAASGMLTIYPNPVNANSVLNIESANLKAGDKMEIFDMQGKLISINFASDDTATSIRIGSLSKGTYLLRLAGERGVKFEVK